MAEAGSALFSPSVLQLLQAAIGGTKDQTIDKNETSNTTGTQATTGSQTGSTSQNTTGTNTTSGSTSTTGSTTGSNVSTTQKTADVSKLEQVFAQQQAGISPELLNAIFTQGASQVPGLVSTMANAVGARQSNNSPLAAGLGTLMAQLTGKAAELTAAQRNASGQTAAAIADATGGHSTTGATAQQSTQQQATEQLTQLLQNVLGNTQQNSTQNSTNTSDVTTKGTTTNSEDTKLDSGNLSKMIGTLLGGSLLSSGLQGAGLGGLGGLLGSAQGGANQLGGMLKPLLDLLKGGSGGTDPFAGIFDSIKFGAPDPITGEIVPNQVDPISGVLGGNQVNFGDLLTQFGGTNTSANLLTPDWWSTESWDTYFAPNDFGDY